MSTDARQKLSELFSDFSTAMVVTHDPQGGLRARPMAVAHDDLDDGVWLVTSRSSGKVDELEADDRVALTFQSKGSYLSMTGRATVTDDRKRVRSLWKTPWKAWFPDGPGDPDICLLHIRLDRAEYWDRSGTEGLKAGWDMIVAIAKGKRAETDQPETHGEVHAP